MTIITLDIFEDSSSSMTVPTGQPVECSGDSTFHSLKQFRQSHLKRFFQSIKRLSSLVAWFFKHYLVPHQPGYKSSTILRRARLLSFLSFVNIIIYIICSIVTTDLYPFFLVATLMIFINNVIGVRFHLYTATSLVYIIVQALLGVSTGVYYYTQITPDQKTNLTLFQHFFIANMISTLVSTSILFPSYLFCGIILLILCIINASACTLLYYVFNTPDIIFQNIIISVSASVLLFFHSYVITVDLTETAEKEERIRCLFNVSSDALIIHKNGTIMDANATFEKMFQVKIESILYKVPSQISEFLPDFDKLTQTSNEFETYGINSMGENFSVQIKVEHVENHSGGIDIISVIDTSAKKKLMEADLALRKAEAVNEAKINFLTTVSHEVRTPINGILASVEIVENTHLDETQRDFLNCVKDSANYLLDLITAILDFSKIEAGKMELQKVEFNMITMLEETMNIVYRTAQERELEILLIVEESVPVVVIGDPYRVKQVLLNFLSNAIKFTPKGHVIVRVKLVKSTSYQVSPMADYTVCFEVEDSGIGIKEEQMDSLFTAFIQLDGTARKYQGTGLGLSISKRLCQLMGGEISAKSQYENGSTFSFTSVLQSSKKWTFGSFGEMLALYNSNHSMIHTNNEQFVCQTIRGYVYDRNPHVRQAAMLYFSLLKIDIKELTSEDQLLNIIENGDLNNQFTSQDIVLMITSELSNDVFTEISNRKFNQLVSPLVYWILIKDGQPNQMENQFYSSSLRKPLQFPNVVECIYSIQRVPIPADLYYLLTNNRTSKTLSDLQVSQIINSNSGSSSGSGSGNVSNTSNSPTSTTTTMTYSSSKEKRKALHHHRNSSYSDHVAITRGLVQNNRSPRPTDAQLSSLAHAESLADGSSLDIISLSPSSLSPSSPLSAGSSLSTESSLSPIDSTPLVTSLNDNSINDFNSIPTTSTTTTTTTTMSNIPLTTASGSIPTNSNICTSPKSTIPSTTSATVSPRSGNNSGLNQSTSSTSAVATTTTSSKHKKSSSKSKHSSKASSSNLNEISKQAMASSSSPPLSPASSTSSPPPPLSPNSSNSADLIRKSNSMFEVIKSPTKSVRSPTLQSAIDGYNPYRRQSIPSLDLDSQKEEFSRKSRSSLGSIEIFSPSSPSSIVNQTNINNNSNNNNNNNNNINNINTNNVGDSSTVGKLSKSSFKILLVEDNHVNVKVFTKFLKDGGYTVDVAWNGVQGVEACKSTYYPIIFMDCQMPYMDGYQATATIRKRERELTINDKRFKKSFVIALTANVTPSDQDKCFEVGMDDFVHKPLRSSTVLLNIIDKYLKNFNEEDIQYLTSSYTISNIQSQPPSQQQQQQQQQQQSSQNIYNMNKLEL